MYSQLRRYLYYIQYNEDIQVVKDILPYLVEGDDMIDYSPFWETLKKSNENWYTLTNKHHLSHSTLHRLKHNKDISTRTINDLCLLLNCQVEDIVRFVPEPKEE